MLILLFQLVPTDSEMIGQHKKDIEEAKLFARRMTIVSLTDKDKPKDTDKEAKLINVVRKHIPCLIK